MSEIEQLCMVIGGRRRFILAGNDESHFLITVLSVDKQVCMPTLTRVVYAYPLRIMEKLRMVVIGLGVQSISDHIPSILKRDDVVIVGVCDISESSCLRFRDKFPELSGVRCFNDYKELIASTNPDVAVVAIYHSEYEKIVRHLCKSGVFFMKEKPLARSLKEAKRILRIRDIEKYGLICTQRRFNPLYIWAKDEVIPLLGRLYLFNAVYKLNISNPHEGWRGAAKHAGGGCVIDMGYHIIDQLLWWFGVPSEVTAHSSSLAVSDVEYDAEDTATIAHKYKSGLHGAILLSRSAGEKEEKFWLYGSHGSLVGSKKKMEYRDRNGVVIEERSIDDACEMTDAQLDYFIRKVRAGGGFAENQRDNLENMRFVDKCYSHKKQWTNLFRLKHGIQT